MTKKKTSSKEQGRISTTSLVMGDEDDKTAIELVQDDQLEREATALQEILTDNDFSEGQYILKRFNPDTGQRDLIERRDIGGFDMMDILDRKGGGKYQVTFLTSAGKYGKSFNIHLDPTVKPRSEREAEGANGDSTRSEMLALIDKTVGNRGGDAMLKAMMDQQAQRSTELMTFMMKSMETQATIMAAAMGKGGNAPQSISDAIMLALINKSMGSNQGGVFEMVEAMKGLKELSDPAPEKDQSTLDKILEVGSGALAGFMMNKQGQQAAALPSPQVQTSIPQSKQIVMPEKPKESVYESITRKIQQNAVAIKFAHQGGATPAQVCELLEDEYPQEELDALAELFGQENWFELIWGEKAAKMETLRPWLAEVREEFLEDEPEPEATVDTAQESPKEAKTA